MRVEPVDPKRLHPRYWEEHAACFGHDDDPEVQETIEKVRAEVINVTGKDRMLSVTELFYPPRIRELYYVYADRAKDFCMGKDRRHPCPVRRQCLLWAIQNDEEHGLWGGMSHRERNALVRKVEARGEDVVSHVSDMDF